MRNFEKFGYAFTALICAVFLFLCLNVIHDTTARIETVVKDLQITSGLTGYRVGDITRAVTRIERDLPKQWTEEVLILHDESTGGGIPIETWWEVKCPCGENVSFDHGDYDKELKSLGWVQSLFTYKWWCPKCYESFKPGSIRPTKTRRVRCGNCLCAATLEITIPDTKKETKLQAIKDAGWQPVIWNYEEGNCWSGSDGDVLYSTCPNCREDDY